MKCLFYFGISSMKEGTSAQLSGRGELHGRARVTTLVTLRKCTLGIQSEIKTVRFVLASTKRFSGGLSLDQALQERHGSDFFLLVFYFFTHGLFLKANCTNGLVSLRLSTWNWLQDTNPIGTPFVHVFFNL